MGSSAIRDVERLGVHNIRQLVELAQGGAGPNYEVTASARMLLSKHDDASGGRADDEARARDVQSLLADDHVAALVTLRGGAWFTRILDRIDFDVLSRRRKPIHIFGFSEMTSLVAIAGQYPKAVGIYDMGPGFLYAGVQAAVLNDIKSYARGVELAEHERTAFATGWALARYPQEFAAFFGDVAAILDGAGSQRVPSGRLLAGKLPPSQAITITGGCLSVVLALVGSPYAPAIETKGKWIALEDINEAADPIDRMMAALKLNGLFERAEGIILGDFHDHDAQLSATAFKILKHHLPQKRQIPVVALENFGHVHPLAPLPMHREVTLRRQPSKSAQPQVSIDIPWAQWTA